MRTLLLAIASLLAFSLISAPVSAQENADIEGRWEGALEVPGATLRLVFEIAATDAGYSSVLYSVDQGNAEIPVASTVLDGRDVILEIPAIQGGFVGELSEDGESIDGMWTQGMNSVPLLLKRADDA